jgi:DNA-binding beta-propeller fold protein YncE
MSARTRQRIYTVGALLFGLLAVGALALAPKPAAEVPRTDGVKSDVRLRFISAFPDADAPPLRRPVGVVAVGDRVYVVDSVAGVVRVYDDRGIERGVVGEGTLDVPVYAAVDAERGVLYVTDRAKGALYLFGLDDGALVGTLAPIAAEGSTIATAWAPLALDVAESGVLVVSDVLARHRVLLLEPDGRIIREVGGAQAAAETSGVAVALDFPNAVRATDDEVWVADSNNKRALVFGRDAGFRRVVPTGGLVRGFDFVPPVEGSAEATLVAFVDTLGGGIFLMDLSGSSLGRFGGPGSTEGLLAFPNDVSVDAERGRLYVADTGNRRVQVWDVVPASRADGEMPLLGGVRGQALSRWIALVAAALAGLMAYRAYRARGAARPSGGTPDAWVESE